MGHISDRITIILLLAFVLLTPVFASDFQYTAPSSVDACACTAINIDGKLVGSNKDSTYSVDIIGTAMLWTNMQQNSLSLTKETAVLLRSIVNVPCNANGEYSLHTRIIDDYGFEKIHTTLINVKKCDNFTVQPVVTKQTVCSGDPAIYEFKLINDGIFNESVKPSISNLEKYSQFSLSKYNVGKGTTKSAYLSIASLNIGAYRANVTFTSQKTGLSYILPIKYTVKNCSAPLQQPIDSKPNVSNDAILKFAYAAAALVIVLLLLIFVVLVSKVVKKKRACKTLDEWIEKPVEKEIQEEIKEEQVKEVHVKEARAVAEKITEKQKKQEKPAKKSAKKSKFNFAHFKKAMLWVALILLCLIAIGIVIIGIAYLASALSFWYSSLGNASMENVSNISNLNLSNVSEVKVPLENLSQGVNDSQQSIANVTQVAGANPVVKFFTSFTSYCSSSITVFLVLFILSLFMLGIKQKEEWGKLKQFLMKYLKYTLPLVLFICLIFSIVFCVMNNLPGEGFGRCSVITIVNASSLNDTAITDENAIIQQQSAPECFCHTFFGDSVGVAKCISILAVVLVVILLIMLVVLKIPSWIEAYKARPKVVVEKKVIEKKVAEKKVAEKPSKIVEKKQKKKPSIFVNVWKDILLLIILLLVLSGISYFVYKSSVMQQNLNVTRENVSENINNLSNESNVNEDATDVENDEATIAENDTAAINAAVNITVSETIAVVENEPIPIEKSEVEQMLDYIKENNLTNSFNYLVMEQAQTKEVDLTKYFIDPDGDELFFVVENISSDNVTIDMWKGVATITADPSYTGIANATFVAIDPFGELISADMAIVVVPNEKESIWDKYGRYAVIAVILIILIAVMIYLYSIIVKAEE